MCGIAGSYQLDPGKSATDGSIRTALAAMAHRGPDDQGSYARGNAALGQCRLSVIDTSAAGHQPFTDEDGRWTIAFNGEVFNFRELRAELEAQGHRFRSQTDTEVVLRLFRVKGSSFLHLLNGFFALAIHDAEQDSLFLARDRFGVKPLWWAQVGGRFLFASELRALLAMGANKQIDPLSLEQYLSFHYVPAPFSILSGARKLLPGHSLYVKADGIHETRWYRPAAAARRTPPAADQHERLFELLDDAVRLRLHADVPVGAFLSGGVDSSIVSALAARHHQGLHTFSIGYAEDPFFDESRHAEEVAAHIGSRHSTFRLTREELAEAYPRLLEATDEPFADSSALPSFILCERTRQQVTVAVSGDGADEVFGGYQKHQAELRWRQPGAAERAVTALAPLWRLLPKGRNGAWRNRFRQLDRFARMARLSEAERFLELAAFLPRGQARQLLELPAPAAERVQREALFTQALADLPGMNGLLLADVASTLPNDMLHKVDLTSMAHALEVRTPFLDKRVVEFAFSLPAEDKLRRGSGKQILRETFGHLLPPTVMTRAKKGFEVPLAELLRGPLSGLVDQRITPAACAAAGLHWPAVERVLRGSRSNSPGAAPAAVHALLVFLHWWDRHAA